MKNELKRRLLFISDMEKIIGKNRLTLRRWWEKGIFPEPSKIGVALVWRVETIEEWINNNVPGIKNVKLKQEFLTKKRGKK
jgi:prophage regulatory protein